MAKQGKKTVALKQQRADTARQEFMGSLRTEVERMLNQFEELEADLQATPLLGGLSLFPLEDRLEIRPFGHLLDAAGLADGWREPFIRYEMNPDQSALDFTAEVPGIKANQIALDVGPDHVRLEAKSEGSNYRALIEPGQHLEPSSATATCKDGVLKIHVPLRADAGKYVRHIKVK